MTLKTLNLAVTCATLALLLAGPGAAMAQTLSQQESDSLQRYRIMENRIDLGLVAGYLKPVFSLREE